MASFLSVVVCLIVTIFSTIKGFEEVSLSILFYLESIILGELNSSTVNSTDWTPEMAKISNGMIYII